MNLNVTTISISYSFLDIYDFAVFQYYFFIRCFNEIGLYHFMLLLSIRGDSHRELLNWRRHYKINILLISRLLGIGL
jgi:hypothetical protein